MPSSVESISLLFRFQMLRPYENENSFTKEVDTNNQGNKNILWIYEAHLVEKKATWLADSTTVPMDFW
uniref:Putative ovule protein n=1 Tax=Solanum chacoense TaxID=4108 RepID=A0A0V0HM49_SOLCH